MMLSLNKNKQGFTLIELMVVISIIGVLATVVMGNLNDARSKARDTNRKMTLNRIQIALELYHNKYNTYQVAGSGWMNGGNGWLAYEDGGAYTVAVTRALYNEGFLSQPIAEDPIQRPGYMIYLCGPHNYAISATLENPSPADIAFIQTTCNGTGGNGTYPRYGKNYALDYR
jgi:prepilin-type N-terminal cleavage/methylation domain-containing protein